MKEVRKHEPLVARVRHAIQTHAPPSQSNADAHVYSRVSELKVEELRLRNWNGFVEFTDECKFGLALLRLEVRTLQL